MSFEKPWGNYLLEKIVETPAPEKISFMPQTLAWQVVFGLLIVFVIIKLYRAWKTYKINVYRREALAWLAQCSLNKESDVRQLPALIRKTALLAHQAYVDNLSPLKVTVTLSNNIEASRSKINTLKGKEWLTWLNEHCTKSSFTDGLSSKSSANIENQIQNTQSLHNCETLLTQLAYTVNIDFSDEKFNQALTALSENIKNWIQYHQLTFNDEITNKVITEKQVQGAKHD
ncbi:DUF4381 domain-containing protein [Colwellia sp. E2M01]|uniref:DUF4381 domain-containing protein n=1 Tax=Colwellia sp. E2M01 TaxID=2841561 RepID=UPI001C090CE4|nr:DUF4381 domain-containing protein [Colwellia sp. E2M01]MBU2870912.1 DUF4381 family protein [Colwellia sp. E2M01]